MVVLVGCIKAGNQSDHGLSRLKISDVRFAQIKIITIITGYQSTGIFKVAGEGPKFSRILVIEYLDRGTQNSEMDGGGNI